MSSEEVYKSIPHRPPFLFVDEVLEVTDNGAVTKRVVKPEEYYFEGHYPGNPIMPGVLLCEAVFQTAGIYLVKKLEAEDQDTEGMTPILSRIKDARFKNMVKPGDEVTIHVEMKETISKFHYLKGTIKNKDEKTVMTVEFALALIKEEQTKSV